MSISKKRIKMIAERYYTDVYKFAFAKTRDKDIALEITQETFITFIEKQEKLNDGNICAWLICVCANKIKEYFRKQETEKFFVSIDEADEYPYCPSSGTLPEDCDMLSEVQKRILALLTPEEKEAFIELFLKKKDVRVFAEENGISESAAYTRKSRLKKKAKTLYKDTYFLFFVISFKIFRSVM